MVSLPLARVDPVVAVARVDHVVALSGGEYGHCPKPEVMVSSPLARMDPVVAVARVDHVVALSGVNAVVARTRGDGVVALARVAPVVAVGPRLSRRSRDRRKIGRFRRPPTITFVLLGPLELRHLPLPSSEGEPVIHIRTGHA